MLPGVAGRCSEGPAGERPVITMGGGAWSPPWGGVPGALISRVTQWLTQELPSPPHTLPYADSSARQPTGHVTRHLLNIHFLLAPASG